MECFHTYFNDSIINQSGDTRDEVSYNTLQYYLISFSWNKKTAVHLSKPPVDTMVALSSSYSAYVSEQAFVFACRKSTNELRVGWKPQTANEPLINIPADKRGATCQRGRCGNQPAEHRQLTFQFTTFLHSVLRKTLLCTSRSACAIVSSW